MLYLKKLWIFKLLYTQRNAMRIKNINFELTWPTSFGFLRSVMSYCWTSPWSQLLIYKYLSSSEMRMSVIREGMLGRAQPSTLCEGTSMTFSACHSSDWKKFIKTWILWNHYFVARKVFEIILNICLTYCNIYRACVYECWQ